MPRCDFCNKEISLANGTRVSAADLRSALAAGYDPCRQGWFRDLYSVPLKMGTDQNVIAETWKHRVLSDSTDWLLCTVCRATLEAYQPDRSRAGIVAQLPPKPQEDVVHAPRTEPLLRRAPSRVWKCPSCAAILKKDDVLFDAVQYGSSVQGTATCVQCGSQYRHEVVYAGQYDVPQGELANAIAQPSPESASGSSAPASGVKEPSASQHGGAKIKFRCPNCSKIVLAPEGFAGKPGKCPSCGKPLRIPVSSPPPRARGPVAQQQFDVASECEQTDTRQTSRQKCPKCHRIADVAKDKIGWCSQCDEPMDPVESSSPQEVKLPGSVWPATEAAQATQSPQRCPVCRGLLRLEPNEAGQDVSCESCNTILSVAPGLTKVTAEAAVATSPAGVSRVALERPPSARGLRVIVNSIGMELTLIPSGEFLMGSPTGEIGRSIYEEQHRVSIANPFYLGVYEVTQAEYELVMGKNPSYFCATGRGKAEVTGRDTTRFPVEQVCWEDAVKFCRRLSSFAAERSAGHVYRLPTEAEWEYACRTGMTTPFSFGSTLNGREANCDGNRPYKTEDRGPSLGRPTTVGTYEPNAFGLYDMHGNVWEWCQDRYHEWYYSVSPAADPLGPTDARMAPNFVIRGGSWLSDAWQCRSASRTGRVWGSNSVGFRVGLVCPLAALPPNRRASQATRSKVQSTTSPRRHTTPARHPSLVTVEHSDTSFVVTEPTVLSGSLTDLLRLEVARAHELGLRPFAYFYADWCGPCCSLRASMTHPLMKDAFRGTYIIKLNADAWSDAASSLGLTLDTVPLLLYLDSQGRSGAKIDGGAWGENTPENMAPVLRRFFAGSDCKVFAVFSPPPTNWQASHETSMECEQRLRALADSVEAKLRFLRSEACCPPEIAKAIRGWILGRPISDQLAIGIIHCGSASEELAVRIWLKTDFLPTFKLDYFRRDKAYSSGKKSEVLPEGVFRASLLAVWKEHYDLPAASAKQSSEATHLPVASVASESLPPANVVPPGAGRHQAIAQFLKNTYFPDYSDSAVPPAAKGLFGWGMFFIFIASMWPVGLADADARAKSSAVSGLGAILVVWFIGVFLIVLSKISYSRSERRSSSHRVSSTQSSIQGSLSAAMRLLVTATRTSLLLAGVFTPVGALLLLGVLFGWWFVVPFFVCTVGPALFLVIRRQMKHERTRAAREAAIRAAATVAAASPGSQRCPVAEFLRVGLTNRSDAGASTEQECANANAGAQLAEVRQKLWALPILPHDFDHWTVVDREWNRLVPVWDSPKIVERKNNCRLDSIVEILKKGGFEDREFDTVWSQAQMRWVPVADMVCLCRYQIDGNRREITRIFRYGDDKFASIVERD